MRHAMNELARSSTPFLFIIDYERAKPLLFPLPLQDDQVAFALNAKGAPCPQRRLDFSPIDFGHYSTQIARIHEEIASGNVYLLNLTAKTPIQTNLTLEAIYTHAKARFKLYLKEQFVCFSPERFVSIGDDRIHTFPMKGTIDATLPDAKTTLLEDSKELAEHTMVVDLLRNDLGIIAHDIKVEAFRYVERIEHHQGAILQTSSHISGALGHDWRERLGDLLFALLPAGSISGTPKQSACRIITRLEGEERGYFCGVAGIFDGNNLESFVLIRFVEQCGKELFYRSGGGITLQSDATKEYEELCKKIYFPFG